MERFARFRAADPGGMARSTMAVALTTVLVLSTLAGAVGAAAPADAAGSHPAAAGTVEANVTAATTGNLRGTVQESSGDALGGVEVEIVNTDNGSVVETVTTASDGTWGPLEFPPGNYTTRLVSWRWDTFATQVELETGETENIQMTADPKTGTLRLEATDTTGDSLGGVDVEIVNLDDGSVVRTVTTASDGSWQSEFQVGNYTARIAEPGWETSATDLRLLEGDTETIQVTGRSTSGDLAGSVTDADGSALSDATVQVVNATNGSVVATVPVDASGSWGPVTVPRGTWEVSATRNGYEPATRSVTVAGGSMTTVDLSLSAALSVEVQSTSSPVRPGETLAVTARVENTAGSTVSGTVVLAVDGTRRDSSTVTLSAGEERTVTLEWQTGSGDAGTHTATVDAGADTASTDVSVTDAGGLAVDIAGTDAPVAPGEALAVDVRLENTAGSEVTETVSLSVGGEQRDSREVTLAAGESTTVTLTWNDATSGDYTATVTAGENGDSTAITVGSSASVTVDIAGTNAPVDPGERLTVDIALSNTGDAAAAPTVTLSIDDRQRDSREVALDAGEQRTVTLSTTVEESGSYAVVVAVGDRTASTGVVVGGGTPTEQGDDPAVPGFDTVAALVALAAALVLVRRRR